MCLLLTVDNIDSVLLAKEFLAFLRPEGIQVLWLFQAVFDDSVCVQWQHHCCWTQSLSSPAWSKLEAVHPDFPCLALSSDFSMFYQEVSIPKNPGSPGILNFLSVKTPALQKAKVAIQLYTGVVWGTNYLLYGRIKGWRRNVWSLSCNGTIWAIKFSCLMFLVLVVVPALHPAADGGSAAPSLQQMILHCSHRDVPRSVTWCQPEQTQMISKWQ